MKAWFGMVGYGSIDRDGNNAADEADWLRATKG